MSTNNNKKVEPPVDRWFDLTLGSSSQDNPSFKFCTLPYEFKPASIDKNQAGKLHQKSHNKASTHIRLYTTELSSIDEFKPTSIDKASTLQHLLNLILADFYTHSPCTPCSANAVNCKEQQLGLCGIQKIDPQRHPTKEGTVPSDIDSIQESVRTGNQSAEFASSLHYEAPRRQVFIMRRLGIHYVYEWNVRALMLVETKRKLVSKSAGVSSSPLPVEHSVVAQGCDLSTIRSHTPSVRPTILTPCVRQLDGSSDVRRLNELKRNVVNQDDHQVNLPLKKTCVRPSNSFPCIDQQPSAALGVYPVDSSNGQLNFVSPVGPSVDRLNRNASSQDDGHNVFDIGSTVPSKRVCVRQLSTLSEWGVVLNPVNVNTSSTPIDDHGHNGLHVGAKRIPLPNRGTFLVYISIDFDIHSLHHTTVALPLLTQILRSDTTAMIPLLTRAPHDNSHQLWVQHRIINISEVLLIAFSIVEHSFGVYPEYMKLLLRDHHFLENIRAYNQMFSMTSLGAQVDNSINNGRGLYVFKISGQLYQWIGSLCPAEGEPPRFLQLYIYDTDNEVDNRMSHFGGENSDLRRDIVEGLIDLLDTHNGLVQLF
ncbi:DNA helicase [Tanacetum coccineum]